MAAGASSPELFSSIVALFITHSALGLGTVSEKIVMLSGFVQLVKGGRFSKSFDVLSVATSLLLQIVGSEIFNQLIICAGAVYACK